MRRNWKGSRPIAVLGLAVAFCLTMALTVVMADSPSFSIRGAELRRVNGSIQLLVTVAVDNVAVSGGAQATMTYNSSYMEPADMTTNQVLAVGDGTAAYQVDKDLYDGEDPFFPYEITGTSLLHGTEIRTVDGSDDGVVALMWTPKTVTVPVGGDAPEDKGSIKSFLQTSTVGGTDAYNLYIDTETIQTEETKLGQLSFRVKDGMLPAIIEAFDGTKTKDGMVNGDFLLKLDITENADTGLKLPYWAERSPGRWRGYVYQGDSLTPEVSWDFEDAILDAVSAQGEVEINAYQAYGTGTPLDIADALLRYSPTVRGTHVDGRQEDFTMYWGSPDAAAQAEEDKGCTITTASGDRYLLTRTPGVGDGYTVQKFTGDAENPLAPVTDNSWYDPRGGVYTVSQPFYYTLTDGAEPTRYADPIQVKLTVTPVTVTGITADRLNKSYINDDKLPKSISKLELPTEIQLTTDVTPGRVSLTLPIDSWKSDGAAVAADLTGLTGVGPDGATPVTWLNTAGDANVGDYTFDASPDGTSLVYTEPIIRSAYPWLTVPAGAAYDLEAQRHILPSDAVLPEYVIYSASTNDDGLLTLELGKTVNGMPEPMATGMDNSNFRFKLPGGTIVDNNWFAAPADGNYQWTGTDNTSRAYEYGLQIQAGHNFGTGADAAVREAGQELVRRAINLGGIFEVAVTEPGQPESEFIPVYIAPRRNVYTSTNSFDFTGTKASLYPFYDTTEKLPTFVTLPGGEDYIVTTTYDGITGAEPGRLNKFQVVDWDHVASANSTWNGAVWQLNNGATGPVRVDFGYDLYADYTYAGFGRVENPAALSHTVRMLVQAQEEEAPPQPEDPSKLVRLTYEGRGDAVTETADGEARRIIFDTKQVGYKYTQNVTLTLTNVGTEEVKGIYIDNTGATPVDKFTIVQEPAQNLPAGASTTFTVSYVLNLAPGTYVAQYDPNPLKIYCDWGLLKTFEAELTVTQNPVWRLYLDITPADNSQGDAKPVKDPGGDLTTFTPAGYAYEEGIRFWVLATPVADYSVDEVYYYNESGDKCILHPTTDTSLGTQVTTLGEVLVNHTMPDHDLTVYVVFSEPIRAKLRLLDLQDWSGPDDTTLVHQLPLMERDSYDPVRVAADYDTTTTPGQAVLADPGNAIQLTEDTYLVVIPADADRSQIRLDLREILADQTEILPTINISLDYDLTANIYSYTAPAAGPVQLHHESIVFDSPRPGSQRTATIVISANGESRQYQLVIARRQEEHSYPMNPGNSPYGMIMWEDAITDKPGAKAAYDQSDRFASGYIPAAAAALTNTYWTEAWQGTGDTNYDRLDEALFVFVGEAFEDFGPVDGLVTNTAGDKVANQDIRRSVTFTPMDGSGTTQADQFGAFEATPVTLELGDAATATIDASVWTNANTGTVYKIRPGIYELTYTYADFDGGEITFTRPLILLRRAGDVDLSGSIDRQDAMAVEGRVARALGYEAAGYTESQLFSLRICDANNDRNINNIDANTIRALWGGVGQFYLPVGYGGHSGG